MFLINVDLFILSSVFCIVYRVVESSAIFSHQQNEKTYLPYQPGMGNNIYIVWSVKVFALSLNESWTVLGSWLCSKCARNGGQLMSVAVY